jgi:hypothetical protein
MKKLWGMLLIVAFSMLSCKSGGDIVSSSKKGHFGQAPNITLEELLNRYQFIDASSINWVPTADTNKNEFAEVSARIDGSLGILFSRFQGLIDSGMFDVSVLMNKKHEFFDSLLNEEGFKVEGNSFSYMELRFDKFAPDYGDPSAPVFFNCNGGVLTLDCTVDKDKQVKIEKATLVFDMQSPWANGDIAKYQLIYPIAVEVAENMLVNNTGIEME